MHCIAGTYSGSYSNSLDGITIQGDGKDATIFTHSTGNTFQNTGDHFTLRNIQVATSDAASGTPILDTATTGATYENVKVSGPSYDGFYGSSSKNIRILGGEYNGAYDSIAMVGCTFLLDNVYCTNDGSISTAIECAGIYINGGAGKIISPYVAFTRTNAHTTNASTIGIRIIGAAPYIESPYLQILSTHASATGKVAGISRHIHEASNPIMCTVVNAKYVLSNAGSGGTYEIDANVAASNVTVIGGSTFSAVSGAAYIHKILSSTVADRALDVSTGGEAGIDWANVGSPTTTVGLSGTTVKTATDIATLIGTPAGASVSADIAAIDAGSSEQVSAYLVDNDHTWKFDSPSQATSPKIITENIGFIGLLSMDFTEPMPALGSISSITTTSVADVGGATEPTISSSAVSADKKKVHLSVNCASATASTYTFSVKIATTDSQTFVRKGRLTLQ
jgi:hypothetical protein